MTDAPAPVARDSSRLDDSDPPWPLRPWIMAAICSLAGLLFYLAVDSGRYLTVTPLRSAMATFIAVATIVFVLGVEPRRWHWAAGFALLWGAVLALIGWHSAGYNINASPLEWPFWSGMLAVLVATPLFQTRRDVAPDWRFWRLWDMPYDRLHNHAWTDAVLGAAAIAFIGVTFLLTLLIGEMFHLIGINVIRNLWEKGWFAWMLAGAAFGGAIGLLRERDRLVATLQRLVMIVLAVLAPVLAVAAVLFLLSLAGTGLGRLWASGFSTAALMLAAAAFAVLLANAVFGNGREDGAGSRLLGLSAAVLVSAVLPLALIAAVSMQMRIAQYGWTPERLWGVVAVGIALAYGAAGLWSVVRRRGGFDELLRPLQQKLAIAVVLLALFLALPVVDFGAISTRDQLARLKSGAVSAEKFDWAAMAFDFGPAGRAALTQLSKSTHAVRAKAAAAALAAKSRYDIHDSDRLVAAQTMDRRLRILPAGKALPPAVRQQIIDGQMCERGPCIALWVDDRRFMILTQEDAGTEVRSQFVTMGKDGKWVQGDWALAREKPTRKVDLETAEITVRPVTRRQVTVDGLPESDPFD